MTERERFRKMMRFEPGLDHLVRAEWAPWWDKTIIRWEQEGLPPGQSGDEIMQNFGLTLMPFLMPDPRSPGFPAEPQFGSGVITNEREYDELKKYMYSDKAIENYLAYAKYLRARDKEDSIIIHYRCEGFFWFPRTLLGIERHFYAFYDQPELLHKINTDLCDFILRGIEATWDECLPDLMGIAEDMSYNHGPMLSHALFQEFIKPYYLRLSSLTKKYDVPLLLDSDGDVTAMIPWLYESGIDGIYPLERQAGVDILALRQKYPHLLMIGGYDKMVMSKGEEAMRAEFERIFPIMCSGGYLNSVDHQTPPEVSLEQYHIYLKLLWEYTEKAAAHLNLPD